MGSPGNMSYCDWPPWWGHRESTWDPPELRRLTTKLQGKVFGAVAGNHWNPARFLPHSASTLGDHGIHGIHGVLTNTGIWCKIINNQYDIYIYIYHIICVYIYIHIYYIYYIHIICDQPIWRQLGMAKNHSPLILGWVNIKNKPTDCETIRSPKRSLQSPPSVE